MDEIKIEKVSNGYVVTFPSGNKYIYLTLEEVFRQIYKYFTTPCPSNIEVKIIIKDKRV